MAPGSRLQGPAVRAIFEGVFASDQAVAFGLAALVIPEPTPGVLVPLGLIVLARRRTPRRDR